MTWALVGKLLRDIRLPLLVVALLLGGFQCLWAKVTQRITEEILPSITPFMPVDQLIKTLFRGPGQLIQTMLGGESINLMHARDVLSISYVHPLTITILCVWAIGRAAGAIAGEIDRGTMELLLAQPVPRSRVVLAHLVVDLLTIPLLCLCMWGGNWLGIALAGQLEFGAPAGLGQLRANPFMFLPGLLYVAALAFAVSGYTMALSAAGRFRGKVMGLAVLVTLVQFLVNVIGQLWDRVGPLRPAAVFYYYQPQQAMLHGQWTVDLAKVWDVGRPVPVVGAAVLAGVGAAGYALALLAFCRRDLPAPL
jgi:ABC-2 type transport system permease protein